MPQTPLAPPRRTRGPERAPRDAPRDRPLTVLLVHNVYQQPGGEDGVFEREGALLEAHGHRVLRYVLHNDDVDRMGRAALVRRTVWSTESHDAVARLVRDESVDVVHVHNTLPLVSPAVFWAARQSGAATVHTLHNYRLVCPGNLLLRDGRLCHDCVGRAFALPAVRHGCYRGSTAATAAVAATTAAHRRLGTWDRQVDRFVALSQFARGLFVQGGLPPDRVVVKHNAPGAEPRLAVGGDYALFAGRLAPGKGLGVLLAAWAADPGLPPLRVAGDGPLAAEVARAARADRRILWLGWQPQADMEALMGGAAVLVAPSMWYEGWPLVAVEAMGQGTPVVATDHGAFPEMIDDGATGRLFPPRRRGRAGRRRPLAHRRPGAPGRGPRADLPRVWPPVLPRRQLPPAARRLRRGRRPAPRRALVSAASPPRVAVALPVYNGADYLQDALGALQAQTETRWVALVTDNASTDATPEIVRQAADADPRIRYARNGTNLGANGNFNRSMAAALATGAPFVTWASHDDVPHPGWLAACLAALDARPDAVGAQTAIRLVDDDGEPYPFSAAEGGFVAPDGPWAWTPGSAAALDDGDLGRRFLHFLRAKLGQWMVFGVFRAPDVAAVRPFAMPGVEDAVCAELLLRGPMAFVPPAAVRPPAPRRQRAPHVAPRLRRVRDGRAADGPAPALGRARR